MMWHGFGWMGGWGFGGWMMIFWVLLIVMLVVGVALGRWHGGGCHSVSHDGHDSHDAVDIARERYARGEISEEEFQKIKKDLN